MIGMRKAAVLPDPVGAQAKTSLPFTSTGTACICTGVGSLYADGHVCVRAMCVCVAAVGNMMVRMDKIVMVVGGERLVTGW